LTSFIFLRHVPTGMKKKTIFTVCLLSGFWLSSFVPFPVSDKQSNEMYKVITIDTQFPKGQHLTSSGLKDMQVELEVAVQAALVQKPDYIILPEDARYFDQTKSPTQTQSIFSFLHQNPQTVIVDTGRVELDDQAVLQAFVYNGKEQTVDLAHKRYLVPQGEFMPTLYSQMLSKIGFAAVVDQLAKDISYTVGPQTNQADFSPSSPGVLFCFESTSPWGVRKIMAERGTVPFIAHPISHGWFQEPEILWRNLDSMLQIQAVWNQQYIVSAGAYAIGQVYTPAGKIQALNVIQSEQNWQLSETFIPVLR